MRPDAYWRRLAARRAASPAAVMRGALPAPYMHAQTQSLHVALALDFILRATRRLISSWRFMAVSFVSAWSTPTQARAAATRGHSSPDGTKAQSESSIPIEEMI